MLALSTSAYIGFKKHQLSARVTSNKRVKMCFHHQEEIVHLNKFLIIVGNQRYKNVLAIFFIIENTKTHRNRKVFHGIT
jgi:hypothetical protein